MTPQDVLKNNIKNMRHNIDGFRKEADEKMRKANAMEAEVLLFEAALELLDKGATNDV